MTAALADPLAWELHRPRGARTATATGYWRDVECVQLTGPRPLLRLRVALWTRRLHRGARAAR